MSSPEPAGSASESTLLDRLAHHARERPEALAFAEPSQDGWRQTSWADYAAGVDRVAKAWLELGLEPGDAVALYAVNRPEWAISCFAALAVRGVPIGVYQTASAEQLAYVLDHAEVRVVVVDDAERFERLCRAAPTLPSLRVVVAAGPLADGSAAEELGTTLEGGARLLSWQELQALGEAAAAEVRARLDARRQEIAGSDLATLIYTSGTTGAPKAVMLDHDNLLNTCRAGQTLHGLRSDDSLVSYLPLAHIAEQMMSVHMAVYAGYSVWWTPAPEHLADHLRAVRPTVFFGVPRVWERIASALRSRLGSASGLRRAMADRALDAGRRTARTLDANEAPGWLPRLRHRLWDRLVLGKIRRALGFDRLRIAASGAAPIGRDVLDLFASLGVRVHEVYGLSECCGPATWNRDGAARLGTVGPAIPSVEVSIADDGEVLVSGPNVFRGYFRNPAATAEALDAEGRLHTGDLGALDAAGFLTITGRKKDLMITSGGKNIAPAAIEQHLAGIDLVGDALAIGDGRRHVAALLTLDEEALAAFYAPNSPPASPERDPRVLAEVSRAVETVNERLARVEAVRAFRLLPRRFSIDTGELTPTLKPRRARIEEVWASEIAAMYADD
ncbi:MAG: long-chain fatty acid--CoA ligase [Acidobacteriota bacterium]